MQNKGILLQIKNYNYKVIRFLKVGGVYMIKNSINDIYILIGLLVFAIIMVIDTKTDTIALGQFLLICAVVVVIIITCDMIKYYIRENYYRKPSNVNQQKKIEAIIIRNYVNEDGTYSFKEIKKLKK